jgi:hypothetical protein
MKIRLILAAFATAAMGLVGSSAATAANQNGLVNVDVSNNTVQVPIGVAANVCGVAVNILAAGTIASPATCDAVAGATAYSAGNNHGGSTNQQGLINLAITNNTIQVPIGIAANICGIAANVLATQTVSGPASCNALGNSGATG